MIERLPKPKAWALPPTETTPPMLSKERAVLDCGCAVYICLRLDTIPPEEATVTNACSPRHAARMTAFNEAFEGSVEHNPQDRPAVEVADEILMATATGLDLG